MTDEQPTPSDAKSNTDMAVTFGGENKPIVHEDLPIALTDTEKRIFAAVEGCLKHYKLSTVVRVAGGWVRDKILGKDSDDIDLSLDNMMGLDFARMMNEYLKHIGEETHKIGEIKENPDKSKNLQTATFPVFGISIDVNNLRTETYADDSRTPEMKIGTELEDAHRRDFTINSLYYNINKGLIEDFTGRGVSDLLHDKTIRTPLEPLQTFIDDPLRVLRACRFAARFGYPMEGKLIEAARSERVQKALSVKVTRERFGIEVGKMFSDSGNTRVAMSHLASLQIFSSVFEAPPHSKLANPMALPSGADFVQRALDAIERLTHVVDDTAGPYADQGDLADAVRTERKTHRRLLRMSSVMFPLVGCDYFAKKKRVTPVIHFVIAESLKLPHKDADRVVLITHGAQNFLEAAKITDDDAERQLLTGQIICKLGNLWRVAFDLAYVLTEEGSSERSGLDALLKLIKECDFEECWKWPKNPFYKAPILMEKFNIPRGPGVQTALNTQLEWRLRHPKGSAEECMEYLSDKLGS